MVSQATMIGVCVGMALLVIISIIASIIYFYRLGAFSHCRGCCKKKPKPLVPKREGSGKTMGLIEFEEHLKGLHANSDLVFAEEYMSLGPHQADRTSQTASEAINMEKNRYVAVVPYDQTRVRLQTISGVPGSNYINANYIDGFNRRLMYAATQAPLSQTIGDFWRMVWETESRIIVMVTNLVEKGRVKGEQYWPTTGHVTFSDFDITLVSEKHYCEYIIRQFSVTYGKSLDTTEETRTIWHYHYTTWPDHGVPHEANSLLSFIIRTREHEEKYPAPKIVHCSAGVGRTGTFIVLDAQMRQYDEFSVVNIYMYLMKIRTQRNYLVQQECQYIFIHDAMLEYMKTAGNRIATDELEMNIAVKYSTRADAITSKINGEWELLRQVRVPDERLNASTKEINIDKIRHEKVRCVDSYRINLPSRGGSEGSDYINASYVDSFYSKNAYIITQNPLENTIDDFWRMCIEYEVYIIVSLVSDDEMSENISSETSGVSGISNPIQFRGYIPESKDTPLRCGNYEIKLITEKVYENYTRREFTITDIKDERNNKKDIRHIHQYHYRKWSHGDYPQGSLVMKFVHNILTCAHEQPPIPRDSDMKIRPIVIHDSCGSWRAAVLVMILHLIEQVEDAGPFLDVYSHVRVMLQRRTGLFDDPYQFNYIYKLLFFIVHYVRQVMKKDGGEKT